MVQNNTKKKTKQEMINKAKQANSDTRQPVAWAECIVFNFSAWCVDAQLF